jgi:hypothetical protein
MRRASPMVTMPICSPAAPTRRISGTRILSLMRGSTLIESSWKTVEELPPWFSVAAVGMLLFGVAGCSGCAAA